jgi:osmotically-inducible protein OsmY
MSTTSPMIPTSTQKYHFGSKIIYADGEDGTLVHVIFDPATRQLTHLGVRQGRLLGKTFTLPYSTVTSANFYEVTLNINRADLPVTNIASATGVQLDSKTIVDNAATSAKGSLYLLAIQPGSAELAYLVAHHLKPNQDIRILESFVTGIAADHITVNMPATTLETALHYRPDRDLQQEVEARLFDINPLRVDLKGIDARVIDGVLYLNGNISSSLRSDMATDQALSVDGLLDIKNNLVGDDSLANELAMALGRDPRTRDLPIGVYPRLGVVRLSGAVHNGQQKEAAQDIARAFPGVRSVINNLIVDPKTDLLHVMAAPEGGEAEDIVPGKYVRHTK